MTTADTDPSWPHAKPDMKPNKPPTPENLSPMFDRASAGYDRLNRLMSLGLDASWREALVAGVQPGDRVLDLCCGSARSSVAAAKRSGRLVVGADVSPEMLVRGQAFAREHGVTFAPVRADAFRLPFADGTFDVITVAWGLRNLVPEREALAEMRRVLRPGGRLLVVDSPSPEPGFVGAAHRLYIRWMVPALGHLSPDPSAYEYLSRSILAFGRVAEVAERIAAAGFACDAPRKLTFGAAALWSATRVEGASHPATNGNPAAQSARREPPGSVS